MHISNYNFIKSASILFIFLISLIISTVVIGDNFCNGIDDNERFDCHPDSGASKDRCEARECCWSLPILQENAVNVSYCFFSKKPPSYEKVSITMTDYGFRVFLKSSVPSPWPEEVSNLILDIWFESRNRIRFKIYDPKNTRYEVPLDINPPQGNFSIKKDYDIVFFENPFAFRILRKTTNSILFDTKITTAPLIFSNQFIQISTRLSSELVYGLGEHRTNLLKNASQWQRHLLWNTDCPPLVNRALYGSHAFYINIEEDGLAHGVFLLNSNAMEVDLQPMPALTFRTIGGILDFFIFTGDSSIDVINQYTEIVGRSQLPPFWALGFHLCRWGYNNLTMLEKIIDRNRAIGIPYDVQWNDIDYMSQMKDFSLADSYHDIAKVLQNLHNYTQKYMMIVDPAISSDHPGSYPTYDKGKKLDVFVKDSKGNDAIIKVWPGKCVLPDFTNPVTSKWWADEIQSFYKYLKFDGLWIDMNEPSSFVDGSYDGCLKNNTYDDPPYLPGVDPLYKHSICPSFTHKISSHYNLHNLFGLTECIATRRALNELYKGKRSIIISRSSYPTLGRYAGHWSGDTASTWQDLYYSVINIMEFQFYGIPLIGTDICGFSGDVTEELCIRWMQLGSFYPFMRNHNNLGQKDQDPAAFSSTAQQIIKSALELRYSLLPYMYTLFYHHQMNGYPVVQPLFFGYPNEKATYNIDKQFTWSNNLLVSPVIEPGAISVNAYLPRGLWYDLEGTLWNSSGQWYLLDAPLDKINVHFKAGHIFPFIKPAVTTTLMRNNPFTLLVILDEVGISEGKLYWDDGESIDSVKDKNYDLIYFICTKNDLKSIVENYAYTENTLELFEIMFFNFKISPKKVTLNGSPLVFQYDSTSKQLLIQMENYSMLQPFIIKWK